MKKALPIAELFKKWGGKPSLILASWVPRTLQSLRTPQSIHP